MVKQAEQADKQVTIGLVGKYVMLHDAYVNTLLSVHKLDQLTFFKYNHQHDTYDDQLLSYSSELFVVTIVCVVLQYRQSPSISVTQIVQDDIDLHG